MAVDLTTPIPAFLAQQLCMSRTLEISRDVHKLSSSSLPRTRSYYNTHFEIELMIWRYNFDLRDYHALNNLQATPPPFYKQNYIKPLNSMARGIQWSPPKFEIFIIRDLS